MAITPESKSSQRKLLKLDRQRRALALRKAGVTFREIARQLEISVSRAKGLLDEAMQDYRDDISGGTAELRATELARLDGLQVEVSKAIWPKEKVEGGKVNLLAVDRYLAIMERRAKMLGLDMPTKIAPTDPTGNDEYLQLAGAARAKLEQQLARRASPGPAPSVSG